jgi:NAD(P)-dependent dehydrogenase (short-subunit alcohol dehydrogenase family)
LSDDRSRDESSTEKPPPRAEAAASEGLPIEVLELDISDPASVEGAVRAVLGSAGAIDVLVNNAG